MTVEKARRFLSTDLEQKVVLGVHVKRRNAARRRDEDKAFPLEHARHDRVGEQLNLVKTPVHESAIFRVLLDEPQLHPGAALFDLPNGFLNR